MLISCTSRPFDYPDSIFTAKKTNSYKLSRNAVEKVSKVVFMSRCGCTAVMTGHCQDASVSVQGKILLDDTSLTEVLVQRLCR